MSSKGPIMVVAGTRPEAIKLAPVFWGLDKLGIDYVFVWSGQHYDYEMSRIFFEQLELPEPIRFLDVGARSSDVSEQVSNMLIELVRCVKKIEPIFIYALGDTNTTLSAALASIYTTKPFVHDEAGMRSFDTSMLEEINRRVADALANLRLAPTKIAVLNLLYEGTSFSTIRLVGSTVVDTLLKIVNSKDLLREDEVLTKLSLERSQYILVTIHRRENLTDKRLSKIVEYLIGLATRLSNYKIVLPVHPHTRKYLNKIGLLHKLYSNTNILLTKPLGYLEFISLLKNARLVITDSGGVQEEAFILGKYIVTLRKITEWAETVLLGYNYLVDLDNVINAIDLTLKIMELPEKGMPNFEKCPIGDGKAGQRIARILKNIVESRIIKRGAEFAERHIGSYLAPMLIQHLQSEAEKYRVTLCFDNSMPLTWERLSEIIEYPQNKLASYTCIIRGQVLDKDLIEKLTNTEWSYVDKILEKAY